MQMDKKSHVFTMPFWRMKSASNRCDLFGLYLLLDVGEFWVMDPFQIDA